MSSNTQELCPAETASRVTKFFAYYYPLLGIAVLALSVRLFYLHQVVTTPVFKGLAMDAEKYDRFALFLLEGNFTHSDFIYLNALYPFFLALVYLISGHSHVAVAIVQAVIDTASCLLIYYIASAHINRRVGIIAAFMYTGYGIGIFYTGILLAPTLIVFLTLSSLALITTAVVNRKSVLFLIAGIAFSAAALGQPNLLLFIPCLALWLFFAGGKMPGKQSARAGLSCFLAGSFLVLSLISARNYVIVRDFTPFLLGGINFYIGNNPQATGSFMAPQGISSSPVEEIKSSVRAAAQESGSALTPAQASRYWFRKGLSFLMGKPAEAASLYAAKLSLFWGKKEIPVDIDYTLSRTFVPLLQLPFLSFGVIAPLALLGMLLSLAGRRHLLLMLFVGSYMISVVVIFVTARYRLPAVPVLIIFSAYSIYRLAGMMRAREIKKLFMAGIVLVACAAGVNHGSDRPSPLAASRHFNNLGTVYLEQEQLDKAFAAIQKALALDSQYESARCNLGNIYLKRGMVEESIAAYTAVIKSNPQHAEAYTLLGAAYTQQGRLAEAIDVHTKALVLRPDFAEAHANLGFSYVKMGQLDKATAEFERALEINPNLVEVQNNLGSAYLKKGRLNDALARYQQALTLQPDYTRAHNNVGFVYRQKGEWENAIAAYQRALALDPSQAATHYQLGNVYFDKGDIKESVFHYTKALEINPGYVPARAKLADAYALLDGTRREQ